MPPDHVHILAAGESIHTTYPALFRTLPAITRTYVISDEETYTISPDAAIEARRIAVRRAVDRVKEINAPLSIPFSRELAFPPLYPSTRDILARISQDHPRARFTMDLSSGSRALCTALATLAPWLGAEVYASFDGKVPRIAPMPDRPVRILIANPNYQTILALLMKQYARNVTPGTREWVSRDYLYRQLWSVYQRTRERNAKPVDPAARPVIHKRGIKPAQDLAHGTFSTFMKTLVGAGLVEQRLSAGQSRRNDYCITERGEMAFRFYASPDTSTLVRTTLGKKGGFQLMSVRKVR